MVVLATSIGSRDIRAVGMPESPGPAVIRKRASGGGSVPGCPASPV